MAQVLKGPAEIFQVYTLPAAVGIAPVAQQTNPQWSGLNIIYCHDPFLLFSESKATQFLKTILKATMDFQLTQFISFAASCINLNPEPEAMR
jgi:hypothetical protein